MKTFLVRSLGFVVFLATLAASQDVIPLYSGTPPGSSPENYPEKEYFSKAWNTDVVANVTKPSLTIFKPAPELKNGTAIVICPGGGFMALSISSEGTDVAKYLAARGVTAFVLKYRIARTGEDATEEFTTLYKDREKFRETVGKVIPLAIDDGLAAVTYVRQHAAEWGISPDRVGIIGFSAGGRVTSGVAFHYKPESRPAFVAPIYAGGDIRLCSSPPPAMTHSGSRQSVLPYTSVGRRLTSPPNCTCMPKAAMASVCANTISPQTIGSTGSPNGWSYRDG
jgi:acetyl esterase/lipase